ncbi:MAG TPA: ribbon-helix-helix protein, CopG family, partial [Polyangiales bacterium]|nr:ribbon-helix-helix protein, CopG family [Polyangiales bacterium]
MAKRINARIDDELAEKLAEIERLTGHGTSKIIKLALDAYMEHLRATTAAPKHGLAEFVGCVDGESDLSLRYKE